MNTEKEQPTTQSTAITPQTADTFTKVLGAISELTKSSHAVAQDGPTIVMLTYGWLMILAAITLKMWPKVTFGTAEFSVLVLAGTIMFLAAAGIRLYQFKIQTDIDREVRQQAFQTLQAQQGAAISAATTGAGQKTQPL